MMDLSTLVLLGVLTLVGLYLARFAVHSGADLWRLLSGSSAGGLRTDGDRPSIVRVHGTVDEEETARAPVSGQACVGYILSLEQRYRARYRLRWHPNYVRSLLSAFVVSDGVDARVDLSAAGDEVQSTLLDSAPPGGRFSNLQLERDALSDVINPGESLPTWAAEIFSNERNPEYPTRIAEYRIESGDELFVAGAVEERSDTTLEFSSESEFFVLSDGTYLAAVGHVARQVAIWTAASLVFLGPVALYVYAVFVA